MGTAKTENGKRKTGAAEPPVYAFPLSGPLPGELAPPEHYGPIRRWWWGWCMRRYRRRERDHSRSPLTSILNVIVRQTLQQGGSAFRLTIVQRDPVEVARKAYAFEKVFFKSSSGGNVPKTTDDFARLEMVRQWTMDTRQMQVQCAVRPGEWVDMFTLPAFMASDVVKDIMSLAPDGACALARSDGPPLRVTLRRLEGELEGLEVNWTVGG